VKVGREWRDGIRPETEIENGYRKIVGVAPRHRLVKSAAHSDYVRASADERRLHVIASRRSSSTTSRVTPLRGRLSFIGCTIVSSP
jgi:hypothetical protein